MSVNPLIFEKVFPSVWQYFHFILSTRCSLCVAFTLSFGRIHCATLSALLLPNCQCVIQFIVYLCANPASPLCHLIGRISLCQPLLLKCYCFSYLVVFIVSDYLSLDFPNVTESLTSTPKCHSVILLVIFHCIILSSTLKIVFHCILK